MLRARDDIVLRVRGQGGKERRVTRNAHNEIAILIRVFLGFQQRFA
jgi:hypothetical protein